MRPPSLKKRLGGRRPPSSTSLTIIDLCLKDTFKFNTQWLLLLFNHIVQLNGKTFQESLFSVSIARPRKTFTRNNTYGSGGFERQNSYGSNNYNSNNNNYGSNNAFNSNLNYSSNSNFQSGNSSDASLSPNVAPQGNNNFKLFF